ncbi:monooxygenase [Xylographa soralifera]|nr:monooxygenase [Xylographa soralifera]
MDDRNNYDVVVIGAGISGIYAAKFYLDIHPQTQLVILDKDNCVGGTWNSRRSYDSFWTQWTVGTAEFSDVPMVRPPEEDLYYEFFKAKHTTKYLEDYVDQQRHAGRTLRDRIRFGVEVQSVRKHGGEWLVLTKNGTGDSTQTLHARKLIVASGLTSVPKIPVLPGKDNFDGPIIHQEAFGSSDVLSSSHVHDIAVLGGGKSSADIVYSAVKAGKTVSWIIKETETTGPGFFFSPKGKGPYKNAFEVGMTRLAATFTPSIVNDQTWWTWFLHSTTYGIRLMNSFWAMVDKATRVDANFSGRDHAKGFDKLEPHTPIFWQNGTGGLLNHADFFDTIEQNVRIYCADIQSLDKGLVRLKNGEEIPAQALLCGTGWVPSLQFFTPEQCTELGLPHPRKDEPSDEAAHWAQLEAAADKKVLAFFPSLANPTPHYHKPVTKTPYRLYKHIAPLHDADSPDGDHSIAFVGHVCVGNYFRGVECQAMWATAYLDGSLVLPSSKEQEEEVALFTTWCRRRYLNNGEQGNWLTFELVGYTDQLLEHLGLQSHRKGWFRNWFEPCMAKDLVGLKEEYVKKYGCDGVETVETKAAGA